MSARNVNDLSLEALGQDFTTQAVTVSLSSTTAKTASALSSGRYRIVSTVDCFIQQGGSSQAATTADTYLPKNVVDFMTVTGTSDDYLAGITAGGTGTLFITRQRGGT